VPVIGCACRVCSSVDSRNKRTRSSALVREDGLNILIDTSTDLRAQCLANNVGRIDAVLFTHAHADHVHGIDDLRSFNLAQGGPIPCYGSEDTLKRVSLLFEYIFAENDYNGWRPNLTTHRVAGPFKIRDVHVTPVPVRHGNAGILGYRIKDIAYVTDCSSIPPESIGLLRGVEVLVLGALRQKPHPSHFTVDEAVSAGTKVGAKRTILTHLSHSIDYAKDRLTLPEGFEFAFDGMEIAT
jgi:phosphoribosyl 1,2-cyclic phosphate phosphodiesterase